MVTVTCTAKDGGGAAALCRVTVKIKPRPEELDYEAVTQAVQGLTINLAHMNVYAGASRDGTIDGLKATIDISWFTNKDVVWSSSNTGIATVVGSTRSGNDTPCIVTGKALGCTYITATAVADSSMSASSHIHVVTRVTQATYVCVSRPEETFYQCPGRGGAAWTIPYNQEVQVYGEYGDWWFIGYGGIYGYILKNQLIKKSDLSSGFWPTVQKILKIPLDLMLGFSWIVNGAYWDLGSTNEVADKIVAAIKAPLELLIKLGEGAKIAGATILESLRKALDALKKEEEITISWGEYAIKEVVSQKSLDLIKTCLKEAGEKSCKITSTYRSFAEQARVMYNNIVKYGVDVQRGEYATNGNLVIDIYVASSRAGKTASQIITDMTKKIEDLYAEGKIVGGGHCVSEEDYAKANTLDIDIFSISNRTKFKAALRKAEAEGKLWFNNEETTNKCYHLKIYQ